MIFVLHNINPRTRHVDLLDLLIVGDESKLVTVPLGQLGVVILTVELCHATELCHNYLCERGRSQPWIVVLSYSNERRHQR